MCSQFFPARSAHFLFFLILNSLDKNHMNDMVFGLFDLSCALLFVLPLFAQRTDSYVKVCSLLSLSHILVAMYIVLVSVLVLYGVFSLATQNVVMKYKGMISLILNAMCLVMFIVGLQPYAALFVLVFFIIKLFISVKQS